MYLWVNPSCKGFLLGVLSLYCMKNCFRLEVSFILRPKYVWDGTLSLLRSTITFVSMACLKSSHPNVIPLLPLVKVLANNIWNKICIVKCPWFSMNDNYRSFQHINTQRLNLLYYKSFWLFSFYQIWIPFRPN